MESGRRIDRLITHPHTYTHKQNSFYAPTEGQLLLDGADIKQLDPALLTMEIALVGQVGGWVEKGGAVDVRVCRWGFVFDADHITI